MSPDIRAALRAHLAPAFELRSELPGGGMSRIFLARDTAVGRDVIVKVLPPDLLTATSAARFQHEVALTVRLQHPHILPVLTAGIAGDIPYYITPRIAGDDLRTRIDRDGPLAADDARRILLQLASALALAHDAGIIHRDVKPGNVLLLDGNAILADFGVARAIDRDEGLTTVDARPGTPAYLAPERPTDEHADLYALCVMGWEMLAGSRPGGVSTARSAMALRSERRSGSAGSRASHGTRTDSALAIQLIEILAVGLRDDPAQRHRSARVLSNALEIEPGRSSARRTVARYVAATGTALLLGIGAWAAFDFKLGDRDGGLTRALQLIDATEFASARDEIESVIARRPDDPHPHFALARIALFVGHDSLRELGQVAAAKALRHGAALDSSERSLLEGLSRFFSSPPGTACPQLRERAESQGGFEAWFAVGECLRRDTVVVSSPASPSGYHFRSSYVEAATAYERAATLAPQPDVGFLYVRLMQVLPIESNRIRLGRDSGDRISFVAYPELAADTLAFVPYPALPGGSATPVPRTRLAALEQNMFRLRRSLGAWSRLADSSAAAHLAFAEVLEVMGEIAESGREDRSAITEIRRARELSPQSELRFVATEVRLLVKANRLRAARALADSALARWPNPSPAEAAYVLTLAGLTGRLERARTLLRELSATPRFGPTLHGRQLVLPPSIRHAHAELIVSASMGDCSAPLAALAVTVGAAEEIAFEDAAARAQARNALLARPLALAAPCLGPAAILTVAAPGDPLVRATLAFATGGRRMLIATLDSLAAGRRFGRRGDVTLDLGFGEAWLLAAAGDTSRALERVDQALAGLAMAPPASFIEVSVTGSLVRLWLLGAELAAAAGDRTRQRQWADAARVMWDGADEALQHSVRRMTALGTP